MHNDFMAAMAAVKQRLPQELPVVVVFLWRISALKSNKVGLEPLDIQQSISVYLNALLNATARPNAHFPTCFRCDAQSSSYL
jgi:hypothetical protein